MAMKLNNNKHDSNERDEKRWQHLAVFDFYITSGRQSQGRGSHMNMVSGISSADTLNCSAYFAWSVCHSSTISCALAAAQMRCTIWADSNHFGGKSRGKMRITGWIYSKSLFTNQYQWIGQQGTNSKGGFHVTGDRQRWTCWGLAGCAGQGSLGCAAIWRDDRVHAEYQAQNQTRVEQCSLSAATGVDLATRAPLGMPMLRLDPGLSPIHNHLP